MVPFFAYNGLDEDFIWVKFLLKEHWYNSECYGQAATRKLTVKLQAEERVIIQKIRNFAF